MADFLFALEGLDGSGKTLLMNNVAQELEKRGYQVLKTRQPGGCPETEIYREILCNSDKRLSREEEETYFYRDYETHRQFMIDPALQEGKIVICDRYMLYSSLVYQCEHIEGIQEYYKNNVRRGVKRPLKLFIINTPPEVCMERIAQTRHEDASAFDKADVAEFNERYKRYQIMSTIPEAEVIDWRKGPAEMALFVADRIEELIGGKKEEPAPAPKLRHCEIKMNQNDVPVYIIKQIFDETGQAVDMNTPLFDVNGMPIRNVFDSNLNFENMDLYDQNGNTMMPASKMFIYLPQTPVYNAYRTEVFSKRDDNLVLVDKKQRPIYPVATAQGYLYDQAQGRNVYPVLKGNDGYFTRDGYEVKPTVMQLFNSNGEKVFPYAVADSNAFVNNTLQQPYYSSEETNPFMEHDALNTNYPNEDVNLANDEGIQEEAIPDEESEENTAWYKNPKNKPYIMAMYVCGIILALLLVFGAFKLFGGEKATFEVMQDTVTAEISSDMEINVNQFLGKKYPKDVEVVFKGANKDKLTYNKESGKITSVDGRAIATGDYALEFRHEKESLKGLLKVVDTIAPEIDGPNEVTFGLNEWNEDSFMARYTIHDESKYKTSIDMYGKNLLKQGTYRVDITAQDSSKNVSTKAVTVTVTKSEAQLKAEADKKAKEEETKAQKQKEQEAKEKQKQENENRGLIDSLTQQVQNLSDMIGNLTGGGDNAINTLTPQEQPSAQGDGTETSLTEDPEGLFESFMSWLNNR